MIQPEHRRDFPQTYRKGKTHRIQHALVQRYGYGPVFIAGDSEGDQHMMQDFPDTQTVLIINRLRNDDIGKLSAQAVKSYGQNGAKYLLQGRDDNTGTFLPSQMHRPLGISEAQLLAPPPESSNSVTFAQQQVGNPKMKNDPTIMFLPRNDKHSKNCDAPPKVKFRCVLSCDHSASIFSFRLD